MGEAHLRWLIKLDSDCRSIDEYHFLIKYEGNSVTLSALKNRIRLSCVTLGFVMPAGDQVTLRDCVTQPFTGCKYVDENAMVYNVRIKGTYCYCMSDYCNAASGGSGDLTYHGTRGGGSSDGRGSSATISQRPTVFAIPGGILLLIASLGSLLCYCVRKRRENQSVSHQYQPAENVFHV